MAALSALIRLFVVATFAGVLAFAPARAESVTWEAVTIVTEEWDGSKWVVVDSDAADADAAYAADDAGDGGTTQRFAPSTALTGHAPALARFGPFDVVDARTVRMAGDIDARTPHQFAAVLSAFPGITRIDMVDCPGSLDDEANLALARMVRRAGIATNVPAGGSVRSGAVELFLAGVKRTAAPGAEFGVHSWRDEDGHEARDFAADDPVHADYLNYYREMGMSDAAARAFYAFTNRTGFDSVHYMTPGEVARFALTN